MKRLVLIFVIIVFNSIVVFAQNITQTIRGQVIDIATKQPLVGATVVLETHDIGSTTDENGNFRMIEVPIGRYRLKVSYVGYNSVILPELLVEGSKEVVKQIELSATESTLNEVVVQAANRNYSGVSVQHLTVEQTQRLPATYYDPARMMTAYAGVVGQNDQGNTLIIRGNSPNAVTWRLEGIDIPNPNHTPNAGTFSDRITQSGGGVNMLSAQLLDDASFLTGAFPAEYGNTIGGVLDMRLRKGNNERMERTFQIGLIGIDAAIEGPFSKKHKASYLMNYRYSTLGLLSAIGVNLGDEKIGFTDFALNLSFPTEKYGDFTVFGVTGRSSNIFEAQKDTTVWEFEKDRQDISFKSSTWIVGATHSISLNEKTAWKTVLSASNWNNERFAMTLGDTFENIATDRDAFVNQRFSLRSVLTYKMNLKSTLQTGLLATDLNYKLESYKIRPRNVVAFGNGGGLLWQPFANLNWKPVNTLSLNAGLHFSRLSFSDSQSVEPRISAKWQFLNQHFLSFAYGLHSQMQLPTIYFTAIPLPNDSGFSFPNQDLDFTKSHHFVIGYQTIFQENTLFKLETYYQQLFNVPIIDDLNSSYSVLNELDGLGGIILENAGTGRNYGLEISLQRYLKNDFYYVANTSIYESKYTGGDGIERNTRYNGNYVMNLTTGKEWSWLNKKEKTKMLGLNIRTVYAGGLRSTPIDATASSVSNTTVYIDSEAFSLKNKDYFKIDFRCYYKRNKTNYTSTVALDIQNLTNRKNIAFQYYDSEQSQVITKYQLGLIPILSWKLEF